MIHGVKFWLNHFGELQKKSFPWFQGVEIILWRIQYLVNLIIVGYKKINFEILLDLIIAVKN